MATVGSASLYIGWRRSVSATMRQPHVAGEKLFVDYAGDTVPVFDGAPGRSDVRTCSSPCSGHRITPMPKPDGARGWLTGSVRTSTRSHSSAARRSCWFATICGLGCTATCRYEPGINRTYQEMAAHYERSGAADPGPPPAR